MDTMEMEESSIKAKWPAPHTRIYAELLSDFQARLKEKGAAKTMAPHIGKGMTFGLPFPLASEVDDAYIFNLSAPHQPTAPPPRRPTAPLRGLLSTLYRVEWSRVE